MEREEPGNNERHDKHLNCLDQYMEIQRQVSSRHLRLLTTIVIIIEVAMCIIIPWLIMGRVVISMCIIEIFSKISSNFKNEVPILQF